MQLQEPAIHRTDAEGKPKNHLHSGETVQLDPGEAVLTCKSRHPILVFETKCLSLEIAGGNKFVMLSQSTNPIFRYIERVMMMTMKLHACCWFASCSKEYEANGWCMPDAPVVVFVAILIALLATFRCHHVELSNTAG